MQVDDLRVVRTLGQTLSFSKTAERLCISQSSVSRAVARVERELGQKLFERSTHAVALTEAGQVALKTAGTIVGAFDAMLKRMAEFSRGEHGSVRFAEIYYAMDRYLTEPLIRFSAAYPDVRLDVMPMVPSKVEAAVASGDADVGFSVSCGEPDEGRGFSCLKFATERFLALVPEDHELASKESIDEADLDGRLLALLGGEQNTERALLAHFESRSIRVGGVIHYKIDHYGADILSANAVALVPDCMADFPHRRFVLRSFNSDLYASYYFLRREDCDNPAVELFLSTVLLQQDVSRSSNG